MDLEQIVREECIQTRVVLADKEAALRMVVDTAKRSGRLRDVSQEQLYAALTDREALAGTGFGHGIAIPHCRIPCVSDFTVGVLTVPDGVDFGAMDDQPVRLIVFIIGPEGEAHDYLQMLAIVARRLAKASQVEAMVAASTPVEVRALLLERPDGPVPTARTMTRSVVHLVVQDEDVFRRAVAVVAAVAPASFVVIEGQSSGAYLADVPLYAGFWSDMGRSLCNVILAVMDSDTADVLVECLETELGTLDEAKGLALMVHDLRTCLGGLRA